MKPDALSRQFQKGDDDMATPVSDAILQPAHMLAALTWGVEERVKAALENQP